MRTTAPFGLALAGLLALAAPLALTGCTAMPAATPTPAPTPSFTCTPEAGGAGYACDQRSYDDMVAQDALYAEAEQVYRKLFAEEVRLYREGATISLAITEYAQGAYLLATEELHRKQHEEGYKAVGGDYILGYVRRNPNASKSGSVVSLTTCIDSTTVTAMKGSQTVGTGQIVRENLYFVRTAGVLKITDFDSEAVSSCA